MCMWAELYEGPQHTRDSECSGSSLPATRSPQPAGGVLDGGEEDTLYT